MATLIETIRKLNSVETAATTVLISIGEKDMGYHFDLKNVKSSTRSEVGKLVAKLEGWRKGDEEYADIIATAVEHGFTIVGSRQHADKVKALIAKHIPDAAFTEKEVASVETAAPRRKPVSNRTAKSRARKTRKRAAATDKQKMARAWAQLEKKKEALKALKAGIDKLETNIRRMSSRIGVGLDAVEKHTKSMTKGR